MDWSPDTPLNKIGMPYYRDILLSAWPTHLTFEVGAPPAKIDAALVTKLKRADMGMFNMLNDEYIQVFFGKDVYPICGSCRTATGR
jgi:hypothetical protein